MRAIAVVVLVVSTACVCLGAGPANPGSSQIEQGMRDFDRNVELGAILEVRSGTQAELGELRLLAERGLKQARDLVAQQPDSADAHYLLGSWLLYAYRVVEVEQITFDARTGPKSETASRVSQGLATDPDEGLKALQRATELAPQNGEYLLDYAAALADYDKTYEAQGILKAVWAGQPDLAADYRMRAGLLLATIAEAAGDIAGAREWIYSSLSLHPIAATAVEQLRRLDAAEAAAGAAVEQLPGEVYPEEYEEVEQGYDEEVEEQYEESEEGYSEEQEYGEAEQEYYEEPEEPYWEEPEEPYWEEPEEPYWEEPQQPYWEEDEQ